MQERQDGDERKKPFWFTLFDDLSIAQLLAGALAAVTSMLLASRIGIAGSLIGTAVGSIVSAVASQVYKKFLSASAEKIKDIAPTHSSSASDAKDRLADEANESVGVEAKEGFSSVATHVFGAVDSARNGVVSAGETVAMGALGANDASSMGTRALGAADAHAPHHASMSDKTVVLQAASPAASLRGSSPQAVLGNEPSAESKAYAESALARARAARERKAKIQKSAVIVAAVSALVAMLLSAVVIEVVTAGQGVGAKTPSIVASWHEPKDVEQDAPHAQGASQDTGESKDSGKAHSSDASSSSTSDQGSSSSKEDSPVSTGSDFLRREMGLKTSRVRPHRAARRARPVTGHRPMAPATREAWIPERAGTREALPPAALLHRVIHRAPVRLLLARAGYPRVKAGRLPVRNTMFDMHCHLGFSKDGEAVARHATGRLAAFSATVDPASYEENARRFFLHSNVRVGLGLHPWFVSDDDAQIERFEAIAPSSAFIGEVGLDFSPRHDATRERQIEVFERVVAACLEDAQSLGRALAAGEEPCVSGLVSIHAVRAVDEVIDVFERAGALRGASRRTPALAGGRALVLHSFAGTSVRATTRFGLRLFRIVRPAGHAHQAWPGLCARRSREQAFDRD